MVVMMVVMSSTAKAMEHKKLRVCADSAMELMNEVVMSILFPAALFLIFSIVNIWFAPISSTAKEVSFFFFLDWKEGSESIRIF
ncbi:unnamed protein product [Camellia sinensis]